MIYLSLFLLSYIVNEINGMDHLDAGVTAKLPSDFVEFDHTDPIASHPKMQQVVNNILERKIRRGLTNPNTLTLDEKRVILDAHNNIRSETARGIYEGPGSTYQPQGCNMNALAWSAALEKAATEWSGRCYFEHNDNRANDMRTAATSAEPGWIVTDSDSVGENLYVSGADPALNAYFGEKNYGIMGGVNDGWCYDEAKLYTYTPSPGAAGTGHYTQVIWANTRYVGCGFQQCSGVSTDSGSYTWAKMIFTCNYFPAGNYYGQKPYQEGTPCTCCDSDRKVCSHDGGLCGGGWNKRYNVASYTGDKSIPDHCLDGLDRWVCPNQDPTPQPTEKPSPSPTPQPTSPTTSAPSPTPRPTKKPTPQPTTKEPTTTTQKPTRTPITKIPTFLPQPPQKDETHPPTPLPTPSPSKDPSPAPTKGPTITRVTPEPTNDGETIIKYALRVTTEAIWLTRSYDFENIESAIEDLMFEHLTERYIGLISSVDADGKEILGPYCPRSGCTFIYGFVTLPMVIEEATLEQKNEIKMRIDNGTYQEEFCNALTLQYQGAPNSDEYNARGLQCYRITATIDSITQSEYNAFIGDLDNDGIPFDTFNLESYSGADIFVLLIFLSFICCACWCVGWYSHKKKFQKELEKELNLAANFNQQQHETDLRRQMAANAQPDMFEKGIGRFRNN